ncbi:hypothetical protein CTI12_AA145910 [Artemisia annua]|uniref:Uncharacterized protein n=1 Tax=Artemisia annua TaxID=35608 RepID=A0A2U1PJZ2_ARTAN|nr:hypothetical protein CTI12_AA145910 [Artemisia annua]
MAADALQGIKPMITPKDAMPWVGSLYVAGASLACTFAMAADAFQGFRQWKLWFPNKYFALNTVSITLIAIAMELPVDLTTNMSNNDGDRNGKIVSIIFLATMITNFLPSLALMDDKELLVNMVAWSILLITVTVNVTIQIIAGMLPALSTLILLFPTLWVFSIAFTVPASRRILENRYKELHGLASYPQEIKFSYEELEHNVKKYWIMAETGNPQFAIACSDVVSAFGVIGSLLCFISLVQLLSLKYPAQYSDYNWSLKVIVCIQSIGACIGSIAPAFRCFAAINCFELSKKRIVNHLNIFKVEEQWLRFWKGSHVRSHIPGHHCKIVFHITKNLILNICIALQIMVVVICKLLALVDRSFLILISYCWYFCKLLIRSKKVVNVSNSNVRSEIKEYDMYVLQIEDDAKLSERISINALKSINKLLSKSEKNEPGNLIKLLKKSTGFVGVLEFDNDQVPPLHSEDTKNSWSLVVVTLTAIVVVLPNTADNHDSDLVKTRKAARRLWTQVEVYRKWLQIDLQKNAHDGKTSKEILEWLRDEAIKIVMHELEYWPIDGELFEWISNMIADILCTCFTNLPRAIKMMCHHNAIEKREDSVRSAAQLLGRSRKILEILNTRQLPNIDVDSMAYISNWHALQKSEIPNGAPLNQIQLASPSPNIVYIKTEPYYVSFMQNFGKDSAAMFICQVSDNEDNYKWWNGLTLEDQLEDH